MIPRFLARMATPRAGSSARGLLPQIQKRTYLDKATYEKEVPDPIKKVVEREPLPTQEEGSGTCRIEADAARRRMQAELADYGKPLKQPTKSSLRWTEENAERVKQKHPAVVDGEGVATPTSEWATGDHHAVTVLSKTKDGNNFVVHDPDRTHHPKTQQAHRDQRAEPRHNLRIMSQEELESVRPRTIDAPFDPPTTVPVVEQSGAPSKSWFSWWKK